jgi:hypothetical protein
MGFRAGIGARTFESLRSSFYLLGLWHSQELRHDSRVLTAIRRCIGSDLPELGPELGPIV